MLRGDLPPVDLSKGEGRPVVREGPVLGAWGRARMGDGPPEAARLVLPPPLCSRTSSLPICWAISVSRSYPCASQEDPSPSQSLKPSSSR